MEIKIKCLHCGKSNYKKKGFRKTQNRGKIQKFYCFECHRYFTNDEGFYRMRNSEEKITECIDIYFSNLSSRKVRNHLRRHRPKNASHETILNWCRKYVLKVTKYIDTLQPNLSGKVYADETEIDCERRNDIFWCAIDWDTRYISATYYSPKTQDVDDAIEFLKKAIKFGKPKFIQTDAATFYPKAINKLFFNKYITGKGWHNKFEVEHKVVNYSKDKRYNVRIETVFSKIKDRVDDFRGFKALWSAPILMQGIIIQHNFIESHTTTGQVPSELANLKLELGQNR